MLVQLSTDYVVEGKTGGNCVEEAFLVLSVNMVVQKGQEICLPSRKTRKPLLYGRLGSMAGMVIVLSIRFSGRHDWDKKSIFWGINTAIQSV